MDLPHPARENLSVWGQAREVGEKRGREASSERWEPTKRALEGGRPVRKEGADKECPRSAHRSSPGYAVRSPPALARTPPTSSLILCYKQEPLVSGAVG